MSWVRIHDGAMTHPKVIGLSHQAFRLWVWGLSYAQQHLTDGVLTAEAVPLKLKRATGDLVTKQLWEAHAVGFRIHDYLDWNDSRETVIGKREAARSRLQRWAEKRGPSEATQRVANADTATLLARSGWGKSTSSSEGESEGKPSDELLAERAGRLREELYPAWYAQYRHGARLRLVANSLEFQDALSLVQTWDDARLEKLAKIVLTTDDPFIAQTDRGFKIFCLKVSWADDRLRQAESGAA